jgi:hypothetical protein
MSKGTQDRRTMRIYPWKARTRELRPDLFEVLGGSAGQTDRNDHLLDVRA